MKKIVWALSLMTLPLFANDAWSQGELDQLRTLFQEGLHGPSFSKGQYTTTHQGAVHHPVKIATFGEWLELEDGSIWNVAGYDQYKVRRWFGESLFILPNHNWFSSYDYSIVNLSTGDVVEVNLNLGPVYHGAYTFTVVAINDQTREFMLSDGSVWEVNFLDAHLLSDWHIDDTVEMGVNKDWFEVPSPNIVINVMLKNKTNRHAYVRCKCIGS